MKRGYSNSKDIREQDLQKFPEEDRFLLAKTLDRREQCQRRNIPVSSDFLTPQQQRELRLLLRQESEERYIFTAGYPGAEEGTRQIVLFLPDWLAASDISGVCNVNATSGAGQEIEADIIPIRAVRAVYQETDRLSHRDLLGSLMGLGIVREKVGEILVDADSADVLVLEPLADFLVQNWSSAGKARLQVSEISRRNIHIPALQTQVIRDTVSSLRLDAVIAAGFRMARGKASDLIAAGRVQINWQVCEKSDRLLTAGDVLSLRGHGKLELSAVGGLTKKGRIAIQMKKFL